MPPWIMDRRRLLPRDRNPRRPLRRAAVRCGEDHRHLLPADLPGADAQARERALLPHRRGGAGSRLSALPALPAGDLARPRRLARRLQHRLARARPDRGRRAGRGRRRGPGRAARRRRAPAPAAVPPAPRRLADRGRPDAARAAGQAADPRDPPADDRGGDGGRLRQRAALQRDLPAALRPPARRAAPLRAPSVRRHDRRGHAELALPPPYDWDAILAFLAPRAIPGVEVVAGGATPAPSRSAAATGAGHRPGRRADRARRDRATFRSSKPCRRSSPACGACSISPPTRWRSASIWRRTRDLRHWSPRGPACACPAPGTASSSAVRAILGQQITVGAATRLAGKLVAAYGEPLATRSPACRGLTHVFPAPRRWRAPTVRRSACRAPARRRCRRWPPRSPPTRALRTQRRAGRGDRPACARLPGIGEWTAQYIAMRELREPDAFPAADIGLMRAMADGAGIRPSAAALAARAESWRPWRAYAAMHLWTAAGARLPAGKTTAERAQARTKSRKTPTKEVSHADRGAA